MMRILIIILLLINIINTGNAQNAKSITYQVGNINNHKDNSSADNHLVSELMYAQCIFNLTFNDTAALYSFEKCNGKINNYSLNYYTHFKEDKSILSGGLLDIEEVIMTSFEIKNITELPKENQLILDHNCICISCDIIEKDISESCLIWYAEDIDGWAGPQKYFGFPGVVLKVETPKQIIEAIHIKNNVAAPNKPKFSKIISINEYKEKVVQFFTNKN